MFGSLILVTNTGHHQEYQRAGQYTKWELLSYYRIHFVIHSSEPITFNSKYYVKLLRSKVNKFRTKQHSHQ